MIFPKQLQYLMVFLVLFLPSLVLISLQLGNIAVYYALPVPAVQFSSNETGLQQIAARLTWELYGSYVTFPDQVELDGDRRSNYNQHQERKSLCLCAEKLEPTQLHFKIKSKCNNKQGSSLQREGTSLEGSWPPLRCSPRFQDNKQNSISMFLL